MTRRAELAAGLKALGYAPAVTPPGDQLQAFLHVGHQAFAALEVCAHDPLLFLGRARIGYKMATQAQVEAVVAAGRRARRDDGQDLADYNLHNG